MMRLPCPYCGTRDEIEFRFGGESHIERPDLEVSDADWADYLFNRNNPAGLQCERWVHVYGCRQWFNVVRDTVTHKVHAVYKMGEVKPDIAIADCDS